MKKLSRITERRFYSVIKGGTPLLVQMIEVTTSFVEMHSVPPKYIRLRPEPFRRYKMDRFSGITEHLRQSDPELKVDRIAHPEKYVYVRYKNEFYRVVIVPDKTLQPDMMLVCMTRE